MQRHQESSIAETGKIKEQILQNETLLQQANLKGHQITAQRMEFAKWEQLDALLGTNQGSAFRNIAQQYSLEILLKETNQILKSISGRYQLEKLTDGMQFVIIDGENYHSERPVHTLSGGETFIVSLALALALSDLASGNRQIEILFIDEGFGTLDQETLRHVMNALDALQSQGRKVGVITHVEEMKERIPVQIQLEKRGLGLSHLRVVSH